MELDRIEWVVAGEKTTSLTWLSSPLLQVQLELVFDLEPVRQVRGLVGQPERHGCVVREILAAPENRRAEAVHRLFAEPLQPEG